MMLNWIEHLIAILFLLGTACVMYGYFLEPHLIEVTHHKIGHASIKSGAIRIVQLTDIHLGDFMSLKRFDHIIDHVNALEADIVLLTGDLLDNAKTNQKMDKVPESLLRLNEGALKFAVFGNHEYEFGGESNYRKILEESGFRLLVNETATVVLNSQTLQISGADCAIFGERDYTFMDGIDAALFHVFMLHQPDPIDHYLKVPIDLTLSGHTHSGQIRLPILGTPILPELGKKYIDGWYRHSERMSQYVSRGIGMTMLPFRFQSRPEIAVFDIGVE